MTNKYQLDGYRKFLLNRVTVTPNLIEYIESCVSREIEAGNHSFHKVMVLSWTNNEQLFDALLDYFSTPFIPVEFSTQGSVTSFYTSSLNLILKIIKLDFMFPYQSSMFNVDVLFNDKTSADFFENRVTINDIVAGVVSSRMNDKFELDLSDFSNDPEFKQKNIHFYRINLLSHFKILMLRMGRDTKSLNLSNNNISQTPLDILNFFIKGDLTAINLSNNNIASLAELQRMSSKIEKLWLEGNPLCDDVDVMTYVKNILIKFPRLTYLDGVKLNKYGVTLPLIKNYLVNTDKKTKMLVEKFLTLYFTHYDSNPRTQIEMFYHEDVTLSITTGFAELEELNMTHYSQHCRNILKPNKKKTAMQKLYKKRVNVLRILMQLPQSIHDPSTFTVDVLQHDKKSLILVVDGVFKEKNNEPYTLDKMFRFRRTFIFSITHLNPNSVYNIRHEMFHLAYATVEQIENSFMTPIRNMNELSLINPEQEECTALCQAFSHLTELKKSEAELRLKRHNWDINKALKEFIQHYKTCKIPADHFIEEDDLSDLLDDEID